MKGLIRGRKCIGSGRGEGLYRMGVSLLSGNGILEL